MISVQLRIKSPGKKVLDLPVTLPAIPRIGEQVHDEESGDSWTVEMVIYLIAEEMPLVVVTG